MYATQDEFNAAALANIDTSLALANTAFASVERLAALNLVTVRNLFKSTAANVNTLLDADDIHELANLRAAMAEPAVEIAVAYARSIYRIAAQTNEEVSRLIDAQFAQANKTIIIRLDQAARTTPVATDTAIAAVKSAMSVASSAFDSINKTARQVAEIGKARPAAVSTATSKGAAIPKPKKAA